MKKITHISSILLTVLILLGWGTSSCIEELENQVPVSGQLLINGQFSNSEGLRQITIQRINSITGGGALLSAEARIFRDGTDPLDLIEIEPGRLRPPQGYVFEEGREYFVEVELDGQFYRSKPQIIQPILRTDSISFEVREEKNDERRPGEPILFRKIKFSAFVDLPDVNEGAAYYRWVVDEAWQFIGLGQGNDCYIQEDISTNAYQVASNTVPGAKVGLVGIPVLDQSLDISFEHKHYVNVYLHSVDAATFDYYEKNLRLVGIDGTIYDEIPGEIESNIINVDEPDEKVSGWVEFFQADTLRLKLTGNEINAPIPQQCNIPPGGTPSNRCLDCGGTYGQSSRIKPFYWED